MLKSLGRKLNCLDSEDALTGTVFGLMRYLPPAVLAEWLSQAQLAHGCKEVVDVAWDRLPPLTETHFWPRYEDTLKGYGQVEPDVVLEFGRIAVIIEAKLRWGKTPAVMLGQTGEETEADQLARQAKATLDFYGHRERGGVELAALVYVTAHLTSPEPDLEKSVKAIGHLGLSVPPPLYWLSWSALAPLLERESARGEFPGHLIAEDLLEYLREANVLRFRGWRLDERKWQLPLHETISAGWSYRAFGERYFGELAQQDAGPAWTYRQRLEGKR